MSIYSLRSTSALRLVNLKYFFGLPFLVAIYPGVFHYANNVRLVLFSSALELLVFLTGLGFVVYLTLGLLTRGRFPQAAIGAGVLLAFFHTYGLAFDFLHSVDVFQVETYNFLPFYIFLSSYIVWRIVRLEHGKITQIWNASGMVLAALVLFNVVKIIPIEWDKGVSLTNQNELIASDNPITDSQDPDIYYLIFDEAAGFEVARRYWNYQGVDELIDYLQNIGFYIAESSHSGSTHTLREIATRLNYEAYPIGNEFFAIYNEGVAQNRVMDYLRGRGYTLVAYDQRRRPYPTAAAMPVDFLTEEPPERMGISSVSYIDDYKLLVLQNTVLRSFISVEPRTRSHMNMIMHTANVVASEKVSSPKFVYVHLLLPHVPFAFTENGGVVSIQTEYFNWQRYLDNYKFSLQVIRAMVESIWATSNSGNPPVIIIQSDHGARNIDERPYTGILEDYPEEYKTWIINAILLPGCEDASLSQDFDPINTFPIVFNCYFDTNISLQ